MAKKNKGTNKELLASIVADTKSEQGYSLVNPNEIKALVDAGHIEVNPTIKSVDGKIAARATEALLATYANGAPEPVPVEAAPVYALFDGIPVAPAKRGGKKSEEYPFSQMQIGQSFLVPVTADYPKPWETFASTVSSATRRFSVEDETKTRVNRKGETVKVLNPTRKFTLRQVTKGQTYQGSTFVELADGARVFRIA